MRWPVLTFVVGLLIAAFATTATMACSCVPYKSALDQYESADLLFVGRVVSVAMQKDSEGREVALTKFAVTRTLKGPSLPERELSHQPDETTCGIFFGVGETYFVAAYSRPSGELSVGLCGMPHFPIEEFEKIARRP